MTPSFRNDRRPGVWKKRRLAEAIPFGLAVTVAILLSGAIVAGDVRTPPPAAKPAAEASEKRSGPFAELKYRFIGPPGNRVSAVAGVPGDPNTYYAGAASGGVWKSTDAGVHWKPV